MNKLLDKFVSIAKDPRSLLTKWKKDTGKKIIGCVPMAIPEEIIHAAGMLPVTLLGTHEEINLADKFVHPYICHSVRGNFDLSLKGNLDYLDGMIFSDFCITVQMVSDIWRIHNPDIFYHYLVLPKNVKAPYAEKYLLHQYKGLKTAIENLGGEEISEDSLKNSVAVYNENRSLLHRLYQLRRTYPSIVKASHLATVVASGILMPKEDHNRLLSQLLEEINPASQSSDYKPRVIVSGYLCNMPELDILDLIEDLGVGISDDDLYVGRRYFHTLADENLDPIDAMVQRYIHDVPCPTKLYSKDDWAGYLFKLAKEAKAEGVVNFVIKYCESHLYDILSVTKILSEKGIPSLVIDVSQRGATGQIRTRLQAFIELLQRADSLSLATGLASESEIDKKSLQ